MRLGRFQFLDPAYVCERRGPLARRFVVCHGEAGGVLAREFFGAEEGVDGPEGRGVPFDF